MKICPMCGMEFPDASVSCVLCKLPLVEKMGQPAPRGDTAVVPELTEEESLVEGKETEQAALGRSQTQSRRYPALQTISNAYKVVAWLVAIAATIGALSGLALVGGFYGPIGFLVILFFIMVGGIGVITLLASSEVIKLFIDIEKNTRLAASNAASSIHPGPSRSKSQPGGDVPAV